ncbi:MAG: hypothetical protein JWR19_3395 [Pedosphaera sp.]|nr:hypothetical protein [Pedosphaera sp.]
MARNRKNQSAAIRFGPALKAFLMCSGIVICCIGYVWQKQQIYELSRQMKSREVRVSLLREQNDKLRNQLGTMLMPQHLEERVRELKLGLVPPQPGQVWRLPEPQIVQSSPPREQQYAAEQTPGLATP